ncbi:MAG: hypothetical protein GY757_28410 [bacterium]|nr:hypothetical protein [bacterium]
MKNTIIAVLCFLVVSSILFGSVATRIEPEDLTYLGAFRLPYNSSGDIVDQWWWGGYAMTYYPDGDPSGPNDGYPGSIFGAGHAWQHQVSEIAIPVPVISAGKNLGDLNTAGTLQNFQDIMDVGALEMPRTGLAYLPAQGSQSSDKLYFCWGNHLQDDTEGMLTHGWFNLTLTNPQVQRGWTIAAPHADYNSNDYMFDVPDAWASANTPGKILATGRYRDGGWSGNGPAIHVIAPWTQGNPPPSGTSLNYVTLLRYESSLDSEEFDHAMTDYHHSDEWSGAAWLTAGSKSAVVFVGTKGRGDFWYGDENGPCLDCAGERGWWSDSFEGWIIFYDPDDLAAVAAGSMEEYEPQPYGYLNIDEHLYHITSTQQWYHTAAVCFDRSNGFLYVFENNVDDDRPIVHVWKVETTATSPTITVTSPNGGESWTVAESRTITWSSTGTVGNVEIDYSTNNGSGWSSVSSSTANDGSYSWTVPDVSSSQCLVRVRETDNSPSDTSNAVFTIGSGGSPTATISLNRSRLDFAGSDDGTASAAQTFSISNSGSGTMNWTVSDSSSWLSVSPVSGSDAGQVSVSVDSSGLSEGSYTGSVSVTSSDATNSPVSLPVYLEIYETGDSSDPFGQYSTPIDGSTVSSSVPFTGWVLDDIGVDSVKLYRLSGGSNVYIGDAVFVEGARPDVEQSYPGYPMNYRAGWGYMMLTNFLPDGNGSFTISAIATDVEGNQVTLGSKTVTVDNANAVKPFGAIDNPASGGIAFGSAFSNNGWVLTPQPNSIATNGSTLNVYVNGVNLGNLTYGIYRPDIAGLFPGYGNSSGAGASFSMDTTAYDNGVHTIAWSATDSDGNTDGIGSRYFSIQNSGSITQSKSGATIPAPLFIKESSRFPVDLSKPVYFKKGFSQAKGNLVSPDKEGVIHLAVRELERVVIELDGNMVALDSKQNASGFRFTGFQPVGKSFRPLPIGSTFDYERGIFYWQPGPGFVGSYNLVFVDNARRVLRRIKIEIGSKFDIKN